MEMSGDMILFSDFNHLHLNKVGIFDNLWPSAWTFQLEDSVSVRSEDLEVAKLYFKVFFNKDICFGELWCT